MMTKPEFLVAKEEMLHVHVVALQSCELLVALATISVTILSPGMAIQILCLC